MEQVPEGYRRPESVLVVVYTPALEVLLLRRVNPPAFWQSVTGALLPGETPFEAARRELREETGIDRCDGLVDTGIVREFPIRGPWRARYAPEATTNREYAWILQVPDPVTPVLASAEHDAYVWLPAQRAAERASSWTNRDAIRRLLSPPG